MSKEISDNETIDQQEGRLIGELPQLGRQFIEDRPENQNFIQNPDDHTEHTLDWHQFGIVTHTRRFSEMYRGLEQDYLRDWGVIDQVEGVLAEQIDGRSKSDLLRIAIVLHDIGKFARGIKEEDGEIVFDHGDHEVKSENIIRGELKQHLISEYGLTDAQIDYIARSAGLHYELAKMRDQAIKSGSGYTIAFSKSLECGVVIEKLMKSSRVQGMETEVGLLYLGDSLAKTDLIIPVESDKQLEDSTSQIEQMLRDRNLNPKLVSAVKQRAVNIAVVKRYFSELFKVNQVA